MGALRGALAGLTPRKRAAALQLVHWVRAEVPARLRYAAVFGSTARGEARPDSDVDVLLVFERLAPDREPHASQAEDVAEVVSARTGIAVEPWSVSLSDLRQGRRTPMLVDALTDAVPLWPVGVPIPRPPFTPADADFCVRALLARVAEGGQEVSRLRRDGCYEAVARRIRDDLVRMCVAALLVHGDTRPRRAHAVRRFERVYSVPPEWLPILRWAAASFGPEATEEDRWVGQPPGGVMRAAGVVGCFADWLQQETMFAGVG